MEQLIRELICKLYHCTYDGNISIEKLPVGYKVSIPLLTDERPFSISIEAEGDKFWELFKQHLKEANLNSVENYTLSSYGH